MGSLLLTSMIFVIIYCISSYKTYVAKLIALPANSKVFFLYDEMCLRKVMCKLQTSCKCRTGLTQATV